MNKRLGALSAAMIDALIPWKQVSETPSWDLADMERTRAHQTHPRADIRLDFAGGTYRLMMRES